MLPYWGQEVKEPKSVKDGNCGLYRPQVICSSQGLFQHFLVSGFGEQREWAVVSPCILIFRKALVSELQLYSWLTRGWCLTGCLIIEGLVLCGPEQYGLTSLALPSSYVSVHACMHTHTHTHTHTEFIFPRSASYHHKGLFYGVLSQESRCRGPCQDFLPSCLPSPSWGIDLYSATWQASLCLRNHGTLTNCHIWYPFSLWDCCASSIDLVLSI